jgi:hypothetical protein
MQEARRLNDLAPRESALVERVELRAELLNARSQTVGAGLIDSLGNQLRQQDLRFVECGRKLGDPARAARCSRYELVVHGALA